MELSSPISQLPGVGDIVKKRLEKLEIYTIEDLLYHIPHRYEDYSRVVTTRTAQIGEPVTIFGTVINTANIYTKKGKRMFVAELSDDVGKIKAVWFSSPYLFSIIKKGKSYSFSGKVEWLGKEKSIVTPIFREISDLAGRSANDLIIPVYPETKGISSKWFKARNIYLLENHTNLSDEFIPKKFLDSLPGNREALINIHNPRSLDNIEVSRLRLGFNELLKLFLTNQKRKENWKYHKVSHVIKITDGLAEKFADNLSFTLTDSQKNVIAEIYGDMQKPTPMNRLLEGDVGSGKTAVAAAACYSAFANGFQSVVMAPTQILAIQHYKTLCEIFDKLSARISLLTGTETKLTLGKADIIVGTHALLHREMNLEDVALVVIDEQHRFGVEQRTHLISRSGGKNKIPHVLTMTATPIPRTIAMSLYGDLDLSILNEMPKGRLPVTTWIVPPVKREGAYNWIREQIKESNVQVYVICPLIEESVNDVMKEVKSAKAEFENIKKIYPELNIGLMHGKLKSAEKQDVIDGFKSGKINILVSTSVVEVGIDIANATIMMIEAADRFGLAQLHQLRGRVGRGEKKSYCLLFTESKSDKTTERLNILKENKSGFDLAEMDLKMRGPGQVFGTTQSGFSNLKAASWSDIEIIKKAKATAEEIVKDKKLYDKIHAYYWGTNKILN